jgi:type I restriction enzyme S subunit
MKQGWEIKKLGEVSEFQRGLTYSRKDAVDFSENIVLRATNINLKNSCLNFTELKYLDNNFLVKENKKLVKGALLICLSSGSKSHLGKIALVDDNYDCAFGGFIGQIIPNKNIHSKYLFYNLISDKYKTYISELTDGMNINNLKSVDLKAFQIPIPPLSEQKRIVAILDKSFVAIDKAKQNAQHNLKNAKALFESYLQGVFENKGDDWEVKKFPDISENLDSQRIPITKSKRKAGEIPYYGASRVVDYVKGFIFDEDLLCISEDGANLLARTYPIAFSITGKTWVNNHVHILRFQEMTTQKFVELYLNSIKLDDFISGMAQPKLNQTMLNKIPIPLPPLKEQKHIVQKLDKLSAETKKLELVYQQKITNLDELKKSVLQKAFNGEL